MYTHTRNTSFENEKKRLENIIIHFYVCLYVILNVTLDYDTHTHIYLWKIGVYMFVQKMIIIKRGIHMLCWLPCFKIFMCVCVYDNIITLLSEFVCVCNTHEEETGESSYNTFIYFSKNLSFLYAYINT